MKFPEKNFKKCFERTIGWRGREQLRGLAGSRYNVVFYIDFFDLNKSVKEVRLTSIAQAIGSKADGRYAT